MTRNELKMVLFFCDLCSAGVVRFDLGNEEHTKLLMQLRKMIDESIGTARKGECPIVESRREAQRLVYGIMAARIKDATVGSL